MKSEFFSISSHHPYGYAIYLAQFIYFHFFFICTNFCNGFYKLFNDLKWRIASVFQHGFSCVFFLFITWNSCVPFLYFLYFFLFLLFICFLLSSSVWKTCRKNIITLPISGPINDTFIHWEREHLQQWFWIETSKKTLFVHFILSLATIILAVLFVYGFVVTRIGKSATTTLFCLKTFNLVAFVDCITK